MTPEAARATLDRWLQQAGQDCVLFRPVAAPDLPVYIKVRAHVTEYKPHEILNGSGLQAGDSKVIMSSTDVGDLELAWPAISDSKVPRRGDRLIVDGRTRVIQYAVPAPYVNGKLIRIEMQIR